MATIFGVIALTAISFLIAGTAGDDDLFTADTTVDSVDSDDVAGVSQVTNASQGETEPVAAAPQGPTIDPTAPQTISGMVTTVAGLPVEGATIELFLRGSNSERTSLVHSMRTDAAGFYGISAPVACYVLAITPPPGQTMADGSSHHDESLCVNATVVRLTIDGETSG